MFAFFENLIQPFPPEEPTEPPEDLYAFCRHYTRGIEPYLFIMAVSASLIALLEVSLFAFLGRLVDWLILSEPATFLAKEGHKLMAWALLVLIGLPLMVLINSLVMHQCLLGNYPMSIRWQAHRYLLGQSLTFYQNEFAGRIATKLMQTALAVRESVMTLLDVAVYILVYFCGLVFVIGEADARLSAPLLIWMLLYILLLWYFVPRLGGVASRQANARSTMTGRVVDTYTNITTVKLFSHAKREADYAKEGMASFLSTVHEQMRLVTAFVVCVWTINVLLIFTVSALSIGFWMQGVITVGAIAAAIGPVLRLFGMSQWIMWETATLFENIGTVKDGMTTISRPRTVKDSARAKRLTVGPGRIQFDHLSFHYGKGSGVMDDFSLLIKPGEKVGLVGRSGAGKSTLVNLLLRFYDAEDGAIYIDGQNIAEVTQESLRAQIGVVTQDTSLLHRSIRDNILYGRPNATDEDMIEAAVKARAHEFIPALRDAQGRNGYDAQVGERGVKLSGGQRQRIAIARVLLKDAPVLVMDEATAALDSEVEAAIRENLFKLMRGKTVIAIAHRLSTIAMLDRLVVMDEGRIVEEGAHGALIARRGIYSQLWAHQCGGFLGEHVA